MNIKTLIQMLKYKFMKINNDYITFMSFNGKFADSPKAITSAIHKLDSNKKIIWLVNDINNPDIPDYVHVEKYGTDKAWEYFYKSKIIVDNVYGLRETYVCSNKFFEKIKFYILTFLKKKNNQRVYTTWHGTPLKKMGIDSVNSKILNFSCPNTTMILDNKYTCDILRRLTFGKIDIKLLGSPKNDVLYDNKININNLKNKLELPIDRKLILFAPSFRSDADDVKNVNGSGINQMNMMDIDILLETLKNKFRGEWSIVLRFHYHVESQIDWKKLKKQYGDKVINGNKYQDAIDYLKCSDILMTDMSSTLFDFSLTKKPVLLFFPDLENYVNNERGLYIDINELPFSCSTTFEKLISDIQNLNMKEYSKRVKKFIDGLGYLNVRKTSENVAKFILEEGIKK